MIRFLIKAATEIIQIMPAGINLPERFHLAPIMPAKANEVLNCSKGRGGSWEFKWAPKPSIAPKAKPAPKEGNEPLVKGNIQTYKEKLLHNM